MKAIYISVAALFFSVNLAAQTVNQSELKQFVENQKKPFLEGTGEIFILDNVAWQRPYGESEYMLTPLMVDEAAYFSRITALNNSITGVYKSNFSFINVEVTNFSRTILNSMNITIPSYIQNNVIVYLPQIDIDRLNQALINFTYLTNYGKQHPTKFTTNNNKVNLYFENFETTSGVILGPNFVISNTGAANCGWNDVQCVAKSGTWSAWCAGNGPACNQSCNNSNHVENMNSAFTNFPAINTTGFVNMIFSFWMNFDLENSSGVTDFFTYSFNIGSGLQLAAAYNGQTPGDGSNNYIKQSFPITGFPNSFSYAFRIVTDNSFNNKGVYIDDISLTGDAITGIEELNLANSISIYPNPTNGVFTIESENMQSFEITSISGEIIKTITQNNSNKTDIDLKGYAAGIYFVKITTDKGNATKKLILN